jgi:leucyl/phenylalanyl-tRNA--protein transferase
MPSVIPPEVLLNAYAQGVFPMAPSKNSQRIHWYAPEMRGIFPLDRFKMPKNVLRHIRSKELRFTVNEAFEAVVQGCADRRMTWISPLIRASYTELHRLGFAHSVEVWRAGSLVGGLYGVALQSVFCGESMFQTEPEAHKAALWYAHHCLLAGGFQLWDTQYYNPHLGNFGCIEIPQEQYLNLLAEALQQPATFQPIPLENLLKPKA